MSLTHSRERDGHAYFTYEVHFLHRSARDYIANTRKAQIQARIPDFDVLPGIFRLLLAELKFALPTLHDNRPRVWGKFGGEGGAIRLALHRLFTVMVSAHDECGYDVPSKFLEEASHIVQHHTQMAEGGTPQVPPTNQITEFKGHIWGGNLQRIGRSWLIYRESNHSPDFLCEVVCRELQQFLAPESKKHLKQQNMISGPNLLLVAAARANSLELVQHLLHHEGRTPKEMVPLEPIRLYDINYEDSRTIPASRAANSLWLIFLYCLVENFLLRTGDTEAQCIGCLKEFLQYDVDRDVRFVVRVIPSFGDINNDKQVDDNKQEPRVKIREEDDKGETDERVVFDLLEFLELVGLGPSNMEVLCEKLPQAQEGCQPLPEVTPVCGPTISHQRGSLSKTLEAIVAAGKFSQFWAYASCLCLESVITPSERLDTPFAFRIS
ncbi:hypothetical protein BJX70DRAFT_397087 [Aspergillus crustosus]